MVVCPASAGLALVTPTYTRSPTFAVVDPVTTSPSGPASSASSVRTNLARLRNRARNCRYQGAARTGSAVGSADRLRLTSTATTMGQRSQAGRQVLAQIGQAGPARAAGTEVGAQGNQL